MFVWVQALDLGLEINASFFVSKGKVPLRSSLIPCRAVTSFFLFLQLLLAHTTVWLILWLILGELYSKVVLSLPGEDLSHPCAGPQHEGFPGFELVQEGPRTESYPKKQLSILPLIHLILEFCPVFGASTCYLFFVSNRGPQGLERPWRSPRGFGASPGLSRPLHACGAFLRGGPEELMMKKDWDKGRVRPDSCNKPYTQALVLRRG